MASLDTEYLDDLVKRFKGFKSPTDTQKLIILLGTKDNRSDDDNRKLSVLMKAEKKADQLAKARADARRLIDNEKAKKRKAEARRKIATLSAIETMCKDDPKALHQLNQLIKQAHEGGYVKDSDKQVVITITGDTSTPTPPTTPTPPAI